MFSNAPEKYDCPMCSRVKGIEDEFTAKTDIVFQNDLITAYISPKWWKRNRGNVIIIPNKHFENIYDIDEEYFIAIQKMSKQIAISLKKAYKCDGTSVRQHNEPAGNQSVWHYHFHVFPRYKNDKLYRNHSTKELIEWPDAIRRRSMLIC